MVEVLKIILNFVSKKEVYGVVAVLAVSYFIYRTVDLILDETINSGKNHYEKKKRKTITKLFHNLLKYVILIIALLTILSIYGINIGGMVAGLGITATIIGLALQDTFKDIINGMNIILENYFIVGDYVTYGTFTGEVVEFGLKSTKIKNANGEILCIANRNIMEITNISAQEQSVIINIPLPYEENVEKMEQLIKKNIVPKIAKIADVDDDKVLYLGVNELADYSINYMIKFSCKRDKQWQAKRDANKIILLELKKQNISVPYPQVEVHNEK